MTVRLSVPYQNPAGVSLAAALVAPARASGTAKAQTPSNPPARRRQRPGLRDIAIRLSICTGPVWQSRPVHTSPSQMRGPIIQQHIKPLFRRYDRQAIPCASTTSRAITASRVTGLCVLVCPSPARHTADLRPAASRIGAARHLAVGAACACLAARSRRLLLGWFLLVVRAGRLAEDERRRRRPGQPGQRRGDQVGPGIRQGIPSPRPKNATTVRTQKNATKAGRAQ